jgi:hypothetical protein
VYPWHKGARLTDNPTPEGTESAPAAVVSTSPPGNLHAPYTPSIAENVASLYAEGKTLAAIGRIPDMPAAKTLYRWLHKHPEFREQLDSARIARAFQDEDEARDALGEDDPDKAGLARMKFDGFMALAAVNHPERYGKRTTVQGDQSKPIRFVIQTGVPAPLPEKEVVAEVTQVQEGDPAIAAALLKTQEVSNAAVYDEGPHGAD